MFRFHKPVDIVTLFHKASSPASVRVASALKQASANATESANQSPDESQGQGRAAVPASSRETFELEITEQPPTSDQLETILEYVGTPAIPRVVKGARTIHEALRKFKESPDSFQRPVTVDWNNGKAFAEENESEILRLLSESKS